MYSAIRYVCTYIAPLDVIFFVKDLKLCDFRVESDRLGNPGVEGYQIHLGCHCPFWHLTKTATELPLRNSIELYIKSVLTLYRE